MVDINDGRLAELVTELGGDKVKFVFPDLAQTALLTISDSSIAGQSEVMESLQNQGSCRRDNR